MESNLCKCGHKKIHHQYWPKSERSTKCVFDYLNCNDGKKNRTCRCKQFKLADVSNSTEAEHEM